MINFITVLLQFGSFKIHFMKIQLSSMILRKFFGNSVHFFELEDTFTKKHRKLSKPQSVEFPPTESVPCLFTDSPVKKTLPSLNQWIFTDSISENYFAPLNQPIFTEVISERFKYEHSRTQCIWKSPKHTHTHNTLRLNRSNP